MQYSLASPHQLSQSPTTFRRRGRLEGNAKSLNDPNPSFPQPSDPSKTLDSRQKEIRQLLSGLISLPSRSSEISKLKRNPSDLSNFSATQPELDTFGANLTDEFVPKSLSAQSCTNKLARPRSCPNSQNKKRQKTFAEGLVQPKPTTSAEKISSDPKHNATVGSVIINPSPVTSALQYESNDAPKHDQQQQTTAANSIDNNTFSHNGDEFEVYDFPLSISDVEGLDEILHAYESKSPSHPNATNTCTNMTNSMSNNNNNTSTNSSQVNGALTPPLGVADEDLSILIDNLDNMDEQQLSLITVDVPSHVLPSSQDEEDEQQPYSPKQHDWRFKVHY